MEVWTFDYLMMVTMMMIAVDPIVFCFPISYLSVQPGSLMHVLESGIPNIHDNDGYRFSCCKMLISVVIEFWL